MISKEETMEANSLQSLAGRRAFMKLPMDERRRILAEQANLMIEHYNTEPERAEREQWQGGENTN